jgi:hypothetical protein
MAIKIRWSPPSPKRAGQLGLERNAAHEAVKRGEIQAIRIGRRLLVPKRPRCNPEAYLTDALSKIAAEPPINRISELMPYLSPTTETVD